MSELEEPQPAVEDYLKIIITQQQRIYDTLLVILGATNEERFAQLIDKHSNFEHIGPAPWMEEE